jgi:hypothetical protein
MPGKIQQQSEITARGNTALRELARLLARQAAAEEILAARIAEIEPSYRTVLSAFTLPVVFRILPPGQV